MNLVNHLADRARSHPDRVALIDTHQSVSFSDLYQYVCGASQQLQEDGLGKGDTVLILQPVSIPLYISFLGAFHAGLTVMFIDPSAGKSMIRNSLSLHQPRAFIGIAKAHLLRLSIPEIRRIPHHYHSSGWAPLSKKWISNRTHSSPPKETSLDSPALITFTSGSTGMPKAAARSHGFLLAQHQALAESLNYIEGEVDLVTLPIFALANLASGLTSVIADTDLAFPARANSSAILKQCRDHQVTRCAASPAFFEKLHNDQSMPDFQAIYTGGAPVFPRLLDEIQSAKPTMNVVTVYGSTEAEPIAHIRWNNTSEEDRQRMISGDGLLVGKPVSATDLRIIPDQPTHLTPPPELPIGEIGEIIVTGDHVLKGYLNGKGNEENKLHLNDQIWHRTGDAGWIDSSGRVWLVGRCSAAIRSPNQSPIYPFGIECAAMSHPSITRCALILHHEKITLFIEGSLTLSELNSPLVEKIQSIPHIPVDKRHNAKIDYPALLKKLPSEHRT